MTSADFTRDLIRYQFYMEKAKGKVDYQGYIFPQRRGETPDSETQSLTIQFEVSESTQPSLVVVDPLADSGVRLSITEAATDVILKNSYDPMYGARPIRRWLKRKVVTELAKMLIREEIDENAIVYINADMNGEELLIAGWR